jgi:hypothetical protein
MKNLRLAILILTLLSSCTARDMHVFMLSESFTTSNQIRHIRNIQKIDNAAKRMDDSKKSYCKSYSAGLGGFTLSCQL